MIRRLCVHPQSNSLRQLCNMPTAGVSRLLLKTLVDPSSTSKYRIVGELSGFPMLPNRVSGYLEPLLAVVLRHRLNERDLSCRFALATRKTPRF